MIDTALSALGLGSSSAFLVGWGLGGVRGAKELRGDDRCRARLGQLGPASGKFYWLTHGAGPN